MTLRLLLAAAILSALLFFAGIENLYDILARIEPHYLMLLVVLSVVMIWASCLKWRLFIRAGGNDAPMGHLMKLYTIGYFFNTFTPSYVGGDIARSYHLGKSVSSQRDALVATFLERFTGLLAMALLGLLFVLIGAEATAGLSAAIISIAAFTLILACACFMPRFGAWCFDLADRVVLRFAPARFSEPLRRSFRKLDEGLIAARGKKRLLADALLLSLFFHLLTVLNTYIAGRAIGWENPPIGGLFVVVPLVLIVSMAPVTPNGLGIQEGAFLFLLKRIGATEAQGLAVGLLLRVKVILLAAVGALLWTQLKKTTALKLPEQAPELQGQG